MSQQLWHDEDPFCWRLHLTFISGTFNVKQSINQFETFYNENMSCCNVYLFNNIHYLNQILKYQTRLSFSNCIKLQKITVLLLMWHRIFAVSSKVYPSFLVASYKQGLLTNVQFLPCFAWDFLLINTALKQNDVIQSRLWRLLKTLSPFRVKINMLGNWQ